VEIGTALIFVFLVSRYANPLDRIQIIDLIRALMLATVLIPIAVIDVQKYIIPNQLIITGLISASGLNLAESIIHQSFFIFSRYLSWGVVAGVGLQIIAVIGKLVLGRTAMGFGDIKLSVVIGLFLGQWQSLIMVLVGAATCGAIVGTIALTWRQGEDRSRIPFAPFLSLATMVDLIWHEQIWNTYLHLISWPV
jgi:leader peptidase (prepilin peptidase)/N-methyltransferase